MSVTPDKPAANARLKQSASLMNKYESVQKEKEELKEKLRRLEIDNSSLQHELEELRSKQIIENKNDKKKLEEELKAAKENQTKLKEQLHAASQSETDLTTSVKEFQQEINDKNSEIRALRDDLRQKSEELKQVKDDHDRLADDFEENKRFAGSKDDELQSLQFAVQKKEDTITQLREGIKNLKIKSEQESKRTADSNADLQSQLENLQYQYDELQSQCDATTRRAESAEKNSKQMQNLAAQLRNENQRLEAKIQQLEGEKISCEEELLRQQKTNDEQKVIISRKDKQFTELRQRFQNTMDKKEKEINNHVAELETTVTDLENFRAQIDQLKHKEADLQQHLNKMQSDLQTATQTIDRLNADNRKLNEEINQLNVNGKELQDKNAALSADRQQWIQKCDEYENQLNQSATHKMCAGYDHIPGPGQPRRNSGLQPANPGPFSPHAHQQQEYGAPHAQYENRDPRSDLNPSYRHIPGPPPVTQQPVGQNADWANQSYLPPRGEKPHLGMQNYEGPAAGGGEGGDNKCPLCQKGFCTTGELQTHAATCNFDISNH